MKVIKEKHHKTPAKIQSLMKGEPSHASVERVLVVYGEQGASIYYEPPAAKPTLRP
jgi:hypothetical protein